MDHSPNAQLLKSFFPLVRDAGSAIMDIYHSGKDDLSQKPDGSPVTLADTQAHQIIIDGLHTLSPDIPIISEEDPSNHTQDLPPRFFLVDPLDGTREYLKRDNTSIFTVNIALIEDHRPTLGVIYAPLQKRLFAGVVGEGAVESSNNRTFSIEVSEPPTSGIRALTSISHPDSQSLDYLSTHNITDITPIGSSIKFCMIACGEADLYARFGPTMSWDIAAGDAILRSAGGTVLDATSNQPLEYGLESPKSRFMSPSFLARGKLPI